MERVLQAGLGNRTLQRQYQERYARWVHEYGNWYARFGHVANTSSSEVGSANTHSGGGAQQHSHHHQGHHFNPYHHHHHQQPLASSYAYRHQEQQHGNRHPHRRPPAAGGVENHHHGASYGVSSSTAKQYVDQQDADSYSHHQASMSSTQRMDDRYYRLALWKARFDRRLGMLIDIGPLLVVLFLIVPDGMERGLTEEAYMHIAKNVAQARKETAEKLREAKNKSREERQSKKDE